MCCHVAPPTGHQEGDRLVCCSALSGKENTRVWLKPQQKLWFPAEHQLWKLNIKQNNSQSRTEREVPASLFLLEGRGKKVQRTPENPALSLRFKLCSGCAELFRPVFKRRLGGILTLALRSPHLSLSGLQKPGALSWSVVYTDNCKWGVIRKKVLIKNIVQSLLWNQWMLVLALFFSSHRALLWDCREGKQNPQRLLLLLSLFPAMHVVSASLLFQIENKPCIVLISIHWASLLFIIQVPLYFLESNAVWEGFHFAKLLLLFTL